jgi:hypothetical protein
MRHFVINASSERVGGQFGHAEGEIAGDALRDDLIEAVGEEQGLSSGVRPWDRAQSKCERRPPKHSITSVTEIGREHFGQFTCIGAPLPRAATPILSAAC